MIRSLIVFAFSSLVIGSGAAIAQDADGLPAGPGHDTFVRLCSACHAPDLVRNKRLSREGWEEVIQMMIGRGAVGTDAELAEIVDYLAAAFPPKSATVPAEPTAQTATNTPAK